MARKWIGVVLGLAMTTAGLQAGEKDLKKQFDQLNSLTGTAPTLGALQGVIVTKDGIKQLVAVGLPAAKKKELSYNGAFVLGLAAAEIKDMKSAEVYLRICTDQAAKLQSYEKLRQSYVLLIGLYYDYKKYPDAARICRELLELNTNDGKDRLVIGTMKDRNDEIDFREPMDSFDAADRLRAPMFRSSTSRRRPSRANTIRRSSWSITSSRKATIGLTRNSRAGS